MVSAVDLLPDGPRPPFLICLPLSFLLWQVQVVEGGRDGAVGRG